MIEIVNVLGTFLYVAVFARIIISWFPVPANNPIMVLIHTVTEPILAPIRRYVPKFGAFDFTPMIAMLLILFIQSVLVRVLQ